MNQTLKNGLVPSKEEERRINIREAISNIEENLEFLLEIDDGVNDIVSLLEKGVLVNTGEGMPTFEIKLVSNNIRDTIGL